MAMQVQAQTPSAPNAPQAGAPRESGTVKAVAAHDFVLTTAAGQDVAVTVPEKARILLVPPGSKDLSSAVPGTLVDIAAGDRAIVGGTAGDSGPALNATRVIVMKSSAIAARGAADQAAWARGVGGIVRSVDPATGVITLSSGLRNLTVNTSANTVVRRYAGSSVRFEDAVRSDVTAIQPGDQLRARGQRSPDGAAIAADEIVTGSFANFSGVLSATDPAAGTVTLKDLASKRTVTVVITKQSTIKRLPPGAMQAMAGRGAGAGAGAGTSGSPAPGGQTAAGAGAAGGAPGGGGDRSAQASGGAGTGTGTGNGAGRAGMDLSRMLPRLPAETLADLKPGDAVMIVASNSTGSAEPTAITLLTGVEQILAAHPSGETTLSPWSLGGGQEGEGGGEGGRP